MGLSLGGDTSLFSSCECCGSAVVDRRELRATTQKKKKTKKRKPKTVKHKECEDESSDSSDSTSSTSDWREGGDTTTGVDCDTSSLCVSELKRPSRLRGKSTAQIQENVNVLSLLPRRHSCESIYDHHHSPQYKHKHKHTHKYKHKNGKKPRASDSPLKNRKTKKDKAQLGIGKDNKRSTSLSMLLRGAGNERKMSFQSHDTHKYSRDDTDVIIKRVDNLANMLDNMGIIEDIEDANNENKNTLNTTNNSNNPHKSSQKPSDICNNSNNPKNPDTNDIKIHDTGSESGGSGSGNQSNNESKDNKSKDKCNIKSKVKSEGKERSKSACLILPVNWMDSSMNALRFSSLDQINDSFQMNETCNDPIDTALGGYELECESESDQETKNQNHKQELFWFENVISHRDSLPTLEGWLMKKSGTKIQSYRRRWCIVKNTHFLWSKHKESIEDVMNIRERRKFKDFITLLQIKEVRAAGTSSDQRGCDSGQEASWSNLKQFMVSDKKREMNNRTKFEVVTAHHVYTFRASNIVERERWLLGFQRHLSALKKSMDFVAHNMMDCDMNQNTRKDVLQGVS